MKMAIDEGSPLWQGAGTGSRLVFGGYRGLRRWNSRSILLPDVFRVYGLILVKEVRRVTLEGPMRQGARPVGGRAPPIGSVPCLVGLWWPPSTYASTHTLHLLPKKIPIQLKHEF